MGIPSQRGLTVTETANANLQNQINISIIFNYIRNRGITYRAQIARDLGISAPAVSRAIERLLRDGYIAESEKVQVQNGKKAAQISINADRGIIIGVDIFTDPIEISISDFSGTVIFSRRGPTMDEESDLADFLISAVEDSLEAFRSASGRGDRPILAIGVGVPAVVDPKSGGIISASFYGNLAGSDFRGRLEERYRTPIYVENISNLAAIGEWRRGAGQGCRNMVFIEVGNGIGAGIILDGELFRGTLGSAGEIGFFVIGAEDLGHGASSKGILESSASIGALRERVRDRYGECDPGQDPIVRLCEAAACGDAWAAGTIRGAIDNLAVSIVNIMILLNPELLVIGGSVCDFPIAVDAIVKPLIEAVLRSYPFQPSQVLPASLGARASVVGALQFALDSLIVHTHPYRL